MEFSFSQPDLEKLLSTQCVIGKTTSNITNISSLSGANANSISFLGNKKYKKDVAGCIAAVILVPPDYSGTPRQNQCFFVTKNPSLSLAVLCGMLESEYKKDAVSSIHATAVIDSTAKIGNMVTIGANAVIGKHSVIGDRSQVGACTYIGRDVVIGENTIVYNNVAVMDMCKIGNNVILYPGVVIGSDGFGYETVDGEHVRLPQIGNVIIEDNVHIGANTTVDRARFGSTVIEEGTKIDNLVQVAHNVKIGRRCLIVSQVGISGSTEIGDYVVIGGQAGIAGHIKIADGVMIGGQSGVSSDCKEKKTMLLGSPALPFGMTSRLYALQKRIPDLFKRVSVIEENLQAVSKKNMTDRD